MQSTKLRICHVITRMIVGGAHYINVYGDDVTLAGEKLYPDKE